MLRLILSCFLLFGFILNFFIKLKKIIEWDIVDLNFSDYVFTALWSTGIILYTIKIFHESKKL